MSNTPTPQAPAQGRELFDEISRQAAEIEALKDVQLDLSERLQLYERRLDALAQYFREAAYVL